MIIKILIIYSLLPCDINGSPNKLLYKLQVKLKLRVKFFNLG